MDIIDHLKAYKSKEILIGFSTGLGVALACIIPDLATGSHNQYECREYVVTSLNMVAMGGLVGSFFYNPRKSKE